jgi:hypothetical protein
MVVSMARHKKEGGKRSDVTLSCDRSDSIFGIESTMAKKESNIKKPIKGNIHALAISVRAAF